MSFEQRTRSLGTPVSEAMRRALGTAAAADAVPRHRPAQTGSALPEGGHPVKDTEWGEGYYFAAQDWPGRQQLGLSIDDIYSALDAVDDGYLRNTEISLAAPPVLAPPPANPFV